MVLSIKKCLEHLKGYTRINSEYIWCYKEILEGDEDVVWGLLDNIHTLFSPKVISSFKRDEVVKDKNIDVANSLTTDISQRRIPIASTSRSNMKRLLLSEQPRIHIERRRGKAAETIVRSEEERITREWLKQLKFTTTQAQENAPLLKNPYRNGTILCQVIEQLEGIILNKKTINPSNIMQAQVNIMLVLEAFSKLHPGKSPLNLVNKEEVVEKILRGEKEIIWGVFTQLRKGHTHIEQTNNIPLHLLDLEVKNARHEIINIEESIINWLKSLHLINYNVSSILDIEKDISSGVLLCRLGTILHKYKKKSYGVINNPKTSVVALTNIKKAFELFRQLPGIDRKYLWAESNILHGNCQYILEVLNCLYGYYKKSIKYEETLSTVNDSFISYKHNDTSMLYKSNLEKKSQNGKLPIKELFNWIESLGLNVSQGNYLYEENMNQLRNGVLLAKIVSKLEYKDIEGINENPKTVAQAISNIRQVLNILKERNLFPLKYNNLEIEVQKGNIEVIVGVLNGIRKAYSNIVNVKNSF